LNLDKNILVGKGFASEVYAWGEGRVLKLFHAGIPGARAEREFRVTRAIQGTGLPVPGAYELVQIEGRHGIVFERVAGVSLLTRTQAKPWMLFSAVRQLAELHARMHDCVASAELPSQRDWIARGIQASPEFSETEKQAALVSLDKLPEGTALCHGDFHPENILYSAKGPVIIDWDSGTRGHPLGDVANTCRLIQNASLPSWTPFYMHLLLKVSRVLLHAAYLHRYLQLRPGTRREIKAWQMPLAVAASSWRVPPERR
jgi:uncharacterized protein (TIGR02172 family)